MVVGGCRWFWLVQVVLGGCSWFLLGLGHSMFLQLPAFCTRWREHISARSHRNLPRPGWSLKAALSTH